MPINWEELEAELPDIINDAADQTDNTLASRVSSLITMTDEEIKQLFPTAADIEKLTKLMKIVKSAEDRNTKINNIINNAESLGSTILTLISKFA